MKKLLLLAALLLFAFTQAQDIAFLSRLKTEMSIEDAQAVAKEFAAGTATQYRFYKAKEFKDENMYLVVYAPAGVTDEEIEAQKHNENCLAIYFNYYKDGYKFYKAVVNYEDIFPIWQKYFQSAAKKDKKITRVSIPANNIYFSLGENSPNWVIRG